MHTHVDTHPHVFTHTYVYTHTQSRLRVHARDLFLSLPFPFFLSFSFACCLSLARALFVYVHTSICTHDRAGHARTQDTCVDIHKYDQNRVVFRFVGTLPHLVQSPNERWGAGVETHFQEIS